MPFKFYFEYQRSPGPPDWKHFFLWVLIILALLTALGILTWNGVFI